MLFVLLHERLGIALANFVSTSAGMAFSFVVNGLFTFRTSRLTLRQAGWFLAATGTTMWVAQPLLIHGWLWLLERLGAAGVDLLADPDHRIWVAKLAAIGCSLVLNFAAYHYVVWPVAHRRT